MSKYFNGDEARTVRYAFEALEEAGRLLLAAQVSVETRFDGDHESLPIRNALFELEKAFEKMKQDVAHEVNVADIRLPERSEV